MELPILAGHLVAAALAATVAAVARAIQSRSTILQVISRSFPAPPLAPTVVLVDSFLPAPPAVLAEIWGSVLVPSGAAGNSGKGGNGGNIVITGTTGSLNSSVADVSANGGAGGLTNASGGSGQSALGSATAGAAGGNLVPVAMAGL